MQRVITALQMAGYSVLSTVVRLRKHNCSKCGHTEWPRHRNRDGSFSGGLGTHPGVPDLLVYKPGVWGEGAFLGMETKGTETPLNAAQKVLLAAGAIVVVRSEAEALAAVERFEETEQETKA
jgi:hypothetical protein